MEEEADEACFDAGVGAAHGLPDDAFRSGALVIVVSDPQPSGRRAWCGRRVSGGWAGCRRISGCRRGGIAAAVAVAAVARLARHGAEQREYGEDGELSGHGCFAISAPSVCSSVRDGVREAGTSGTKSCCRVPCPFIARHGEEEEGGAADCCDRNVFGAHVAVTRRESMRDMAATQAPRREKGVHN
jgi:hypothetical protein